MTDPGATGGAAPPPAAGGVPGELAEYGPRIIAVLIDAGILIGIYIVFMIIAWVLGKIIGGLAGLVMLLYLVVEIAYFIYLWSMDNQFTGRGQTIGKKVMNIKIINADGSDMEIKDAILRLVGYCISGIFALGYIWILIDDNNQGWHDKIAKTYVIKC
jgi:uncharacterized RDD family membrane protein YckC